MRGGDLRSLLGLLVATGAAFAFVRAWPQPHAKKKSADFAAPIITMDRNGNVSITADDGTSIHYTTDGSMPTAVSAAYVAPFKMEDGTRVAHLITTPSSVQWRHPVGDFPQAFSIRACCIDDHGRAGAIATRSFLPLDRGALPVLSLTLPSGAFFDPDSGIYVVGDAIFHTAAEFVKRYPRDQKWWKYPGNFHFRGKKWERIAHLEFFSPDGRGTAPFWSGDVALRINGNNTRGFAQHALRVTFDHGLDIPLFGADHGSGFKRLVLRSSGNDQDRTFFRDALQHRLCVDLPFETVACVQSVMYVNGAYWGIHNIRERMDDKELARRYHGKSKDYTILADRLELYRGDSSQLKRFTLLLTMSEKWDASGQAFVDSLARRMDIDGFLTYMAAQIILGNSDWPDQNVKWFRYTGTPDSTHAKRDGRWYFIMGDSDQGMGMVMGADFDMFTHLDLHSNAPITRLYKACMRSSILRERFRTSMLALLDGALSAERMTAEAARMRDAIAEEMQRHIRRWRRPITFAVWQGHVRDLLTFAQQRGPAVRSQLDRHLPPTH